jgi:plasmid stability protein
LTSTGWIAGNPAIQHTGPIKATFDLDDELYRAIRVEAARADRSVRDVVQEALATWLASAEEAEDRASAAEALAEYRHDGGESAERWFKKLAAESKATYDSSEPTSASKPKKPRKK